MSYIVNTHPEFAPLRGFTDNALVPASENSEEGNAEWQSNQQFIEMLNAYRSSGGLARAHEVALMCQSHGDERVHTLAEWIFNREVISFEWHSKIWLPMFQFNHVNMTRLPGLEDALSELVGACDDMEIANWFSLPNPWLADCAPADALASAAPEVLKAARAQRYVSAG